MDNIAYFVRYAAIYLLFGLTMAISCIGKLTDPLPQWFIDQFQSTFVADFPGLDLAWRGAGMMEASIPIALLISAATMEFLPKRRKPFLKLGLGLAAITFTMLAIGQNITSQLAGAATLFFYFGSTMATMLVVIFDENTYADDAQG